MSKLRRVAAPLVAGVMMFLPSVARADDEPAPDAQTETSEQQATPVQQAAAPSPVPVAPVESQQRKTDIVPLAVEPAPPKITFAADPIADGGIIIATATFAGVLEQINGTGELRPQQIASNFNRSQLLWIDRVAVAQTVDPTAKTRSNIGLFGAVAFAAIDPVLTGFRENSVQSGLVDAIIYAESLTVTLGVTNLAKMAVRRPRPIAYIEAEQHRDDPGYSNANTDSALSFFSGHASTTAAITATASYLAFVRSKSWVRPVITLIAGTAITTYVSYERVHSGAHFPTDVIAGAVAGAGIGVIVPHIHRNEDVKQRRVWVGFAPGARDGGVVQVGGLF